MPGRLVKPLLIIKVHSRVPGPRRRYNTPSCAAAQLYKRHLSDAEFQAVSPFLTTMLQATLSGRVFEDFSVEFPDEKIIQITLNRPQKLNAIKLATSHQIAEIWESFDNDESLRVGIITGSGRAFCVGADLDGKCSSIQSGCRVS